MAETIRYKNIYDKIFIFISASIIPISIFAPVGLWIPLILSSIFCFIIEKNKKSYFLISTKIELTAILILFYVAVSLLWSINFSHGVKHFFHLCILFFSFKIMFNCCNKVKNIKPIIFTLYLSLLLSCIITISDIALNLGIKSFLLSVSEFVSLKKNFENLKFQDILNSTQDYKAGMYSGLYNRGISVILVFTFILGGIFLKNKVLFFLLITLSSILIFVAESYTASMLVIISFIVLIILKLLKKKSLLILSLLFSFYFLASPFLLNLTTEEKWARENNFLVKEIMLSGENNKQNENDYKSFLLLLKSKYLKFKYKLLHRKMIWSYTTNEIKNNFIFGKGISASRKIGETKKITLGELVINKNGFYTVEEKKIFPAIPLHPHNQTLQIWLELGLIGCFLFLTLYLLILRNVIYKIKNFTFSNIFFINAFIAVFLINQISFGLWQTWWLSALGYFIIFTNLVIRINSHPSMK